MKATLCNTEVVKNIMAGRQTQDRRPLKNQSVIPGNWDGWCDDSKINYLRDGGIVKRQPGDILGLRERARRVGIQSWEYESDKSRVHNIDLPARLKPILVGHCVPNGCFKELIRTFLKVKRVWVERVQDISAEDAKAEGIDWGHTKPFPAKKHQDTIANLWELQNEIIHNRFRPLWESIYPGSWDKNPWVECCEFELCENPEGESK